MYRLTASDNIWKISASTGTGLHNVWIDKTVWKNDKHVFKTAIKNVIALSELRDRILLVREHIKPSNNDPSSVSNCRQQLMSWSADSLLTADQSKMARRHASRSMQVDLHTNTLQHAAAQWDQGKIIDFSSETTIFCRLASNSVPLFGSQLKTSQ